MNAAIPKIDVSRLNGGPAQRLACAAEIGWACREIGFFHIVNHGVPAALRERVFAAAEDFFARDLQEKMQVALSAETGFAGYFPLAGETTDPAAGGDPKEGFDISFAPGSCNRWPARSEALRLLLTEYYTALAELGRLLSRGLALALDLPEAFFAAKLDRPTAILRLLHYPPIAGTPSPPASGCGAHSDYGYLTILAQDAQGGLQVESQGRWIDVPPMPDAFVCNIGEMMALWTNNRYRATLHRVLRLTPGSRYSIPFFFHPNPEVLIETLPSCRGLGEGTPPITSGAYLQRRQTGAYPG